MSEEQTHDDNQDRMPRRRVVAAGRPGRRRGHGAGRRGPLCRWPLARGRVSAPTGTRATTGSGAVITPLLEMFEFGNTVGLPLACSDAGSIISIIGTQTGGASVASKLVTELDSQCQRAFLQGRRLPAAGHGAEPRADTAQPGREPLDRRPWPRRSTTVGTQVRELSCRPSGPPSPGSVAPSRSSRVRDVRRAIRAPLACALIAAPLLLAACGERAHIPSGVSAASSAGSSRSGSSSDDDDDDHVHHGVHVHCLADTAKGAAATHDAPERHQRGPASVPQHRPHTDGDRHRVRVLPGRPLRTRRQLSARGTSRRWPPSPRPAWPRRASARRPRSWPHKSTASGPCTTTTSRSS